MRALFPALLAVAALMACTPPENATAADLIGLSSQPSLGKDLDAFPRITAPTGPKIDRINQALNRADARLKKAVKGCGKLDGEMYAWERGITAPMTGEPFLSLFAADYYSCGGAHPNTWQLALTYDLGTGRPISWASYLPADLVTPEVLLTGDDATQVGAVQAPALRDWYRAAVRAAPDKDPDWAEGCDSVLDQDFDLILWIDAKAGGVAMQIAELPHVVTACNETAVMTTEELRRRGAKPALTDAIDAAHKAKAWQ
ncbi:MAG: hypothetical protein GC145_09725 [Caulobacter sp.]|nr:hypothetical protein [Caulobacter sp.]